MVGLRFAGVCTSVPPLSLDVGCNTKPALAILPPQARKWHLPIFGTIVTMEAERKCFLTSRYEGGLRWLTATG